MLTSPTPTSATTGHCCAVCPREIRAGLLMCAPHWHLVPATEQEAVNTTWRRYSRAHRKSGYFWNLRREYFEARDKAIATVQARMPAALHPITTGASA